MPDRYKDPTLAIADRVNDLLPRLTLAEKVAQVTCVWQSKTDIFDDKLELSLAKLRKAHPNGMGQFARPSDAKGAVSPRVAPGRDVRRTVALVNALQKWAMEETRLGIPILMHEEGLHGYAAVGATSFPQAIGLASTWDPDLIRRINEVIATEIDARGVSLVLSPVVDVARDPRWGRIEETFGEDPYLCGEMGVAAVEGLQGKDSKLAKGKVMATLKHLTGHGQPQSGTNVGPAPLSERELRERFFPPFEQVVTRTSCFALMASYNEIDGTPSHANTWLLHDVLRGEWGFKGVVVSDYYALDQLRDLHRVAPTLEAAAKMGLAAGVDCDLPDGGTYATIAKAVQTGRIRMADLDRAVRMMLELKFRAGLFENPYRKAEEAEAVTNTQAAKDLARLAAERSVVLLKNDGVLPLKDQGAIALIGPSAAVARLGGYYGVPPKTVSILEGVRARAKAASVLYAPGVRITENDDWWADEVKLADPEDNRRMIQEAVATARNADRIILCIGDTEQTSREGWADNHLGDRDSLELVGEQQELYDALKALGKPIVVVLINGRPLATVSIAETANALVEGWYLGEQGGHAMARILFGDANPGGKLPVTIARDVGQLPLTYDQKPSQGRGYLFASTEPLFPFGYGLSYTTFRMSPPRLSSASIPASGSVEVMVDVTNTGAMAGDEVVQLYIRDKVSSVTRPMKELKGFQRVTLAPGETRTVRLALKPEHLRMWDIDMKRVVEPGEFAVMTGPNSANLQTVTLTVTP